MCAMGVAVMGRGCRDTGIAAIQGLPRWGPPPMGVAASTPCRLFAHIVRSYRAVVL
jgi:hypothetical protein